MAALTAPKEWKIDSHSCTKYRNFGFRAKPESRCAMYAALAL